MGRKPNIYVIYSSPGNRDYLYKRQSDGWYAAEKMPNVPPHQLGWRPYPFTDTDRLDRYVRDRFFSEVARGT